MSGEDKPVKLVKSSSGDQRQKMKNQTKKKTNPRDPLKELNTRSSSISSEAPKGCLSFLLSNSSSKNSVVQANSTPETPNSAPNLRNYPNKTHSNLNHKTDPDPHKPTSVNPKRPRRQNTEKSKSPMFFHRQNGKKPYLGDEVRRLYKAVTDQKKQVFSEIDTQKLAGLTSMEVLQKGLDVEKHALTPTKKHTFFPQIDSDQKHDFSFSVPLDNNGTPINKISYGTTVVSTPDTATPPVQASISPEILCEPSIATTPTCFAAGHVVVGVSDKRKCRPRGILTVGRENESHDSSQNDIKRSVFSFLPPPAEACVSWLSPSCDNNDRREVIVHGSPEFSCLMSPVTPISEASQSSHGVHRAVPDVSPLSDHGVYSSFSIESNCLPSLSATFGSNVLLSQIKKEQGQDIIVENSPISTDSFNSRNLICTPTSDDSNAIKLPNSSRVTMKSVENLLRSLSLSSNEEVIYSDRTDVSPLPSSSFQFSSPVEPFGSIELLQASQEPFRNIVSFGREDSERPSSDFPSMSLMRISWRDGLVSRMFDMDEPDCCQWISKEEEDDDNNFNWFKSKFKVEQEIFGESHEKLSNAFGSIEFYAQDSGNGKEVNSLPVETFSCAQSISIDGSELVTSGDSDWSLCYKNYLFEV